MWKKRKIILRTMPRSVVYRRLVRRQWIKVALYIALGAVAILSLKNKDFDIIFFSGLSYILSGAAYDYAVLFRSDQRDSCRS